MNDSYDECRSLYRAARAEEHSSQADRNAVRIGIAASLATGVQTVAASASVATASASSTALGASTLGAKGIVHLLLGGKFVSEVVIGVAIGTAVSTTVLVVQKTNHPTTVAVAEQRQPPASTREVTKVPARSPGTEPERVLGLQARTPQPPTETPKPLIAAVTVTRHPSVATRESVVTAAESAPPATVQDRLVEETRALAQVQEALNRRDSDLAWSLLEEQDRQFSSGQLGEERAAAKIMTLCAAGHTEQADRAREGFLASYPNSPLAKRVKQGCDR